VPYTIVVGVRLPLLRVDAIQPARAGIGASVGTGMTQSAATTNRPQISCRRPRYERRPARAGIFGWSPCGCTAGVSGRRPIDACCYLVAGAERGVVVGFPPRSDPSAWPA